MKKIFSQIPCSFVYEDLCINLNRIPYQRSIQLSVKAGGRIHMNCAFHTSFKEITAILKKHWGWIQKQLLEQNKLRRKYPLKTFRSGESFLFQGKILELRYENICSKGNSDWKTKKQQTFHFNGGHLIYYWNYPEDLNKVFLKEKLRAFYKKEGEKRLRESLFLFSSRMQLEPKSVRVGAQRSLFGSCSSKGVISLNWQLVVAPPSVLNYVVIHELAHLKYLNHSVSFWSLVARFCPEYKKCKQWLKNNSYAMDFLLPHSELHG